MKIVDCHVHMTGEVADAGNLLKALDANGVERIIVFSKNERTSLERTRQNLVDAKTLCDQAPDRISGLAWLEPTIEGMGELAREALTDMGFAGIKIIPDHWFAYEERLAPWCASCHAPINDSAAHQKPHRSCVVVMISL